MSGRRKTIGRNFTPQASVEESSAESMVQYFTLKTGRKVKFSFVTVPSSDVEKKTFVRQETNGRDQSALTRDSLKDIIRTIRFQQFFACIGVVDGERIEILDGSRRRAAAMEAHTPLNIMVTSDKLTAEEARQLAKDIQTAKEHNIREVGLRLLSLKEAGLTQKEIAEKEGLSQAKVTRAIQAATVPQELISLFPVQYELSFSDYKNLSELDERLTEKSIVCTQLIEKISSQLDSLVADEHLQEDEKKAAILKLIAKGAASLIAAPAKEKATVSPLWSFKEKDKYARKRVKGRSFTYEFNRLSKELQGEIDAAIQNVLQRHLGE
ncbi:chromosome partitioning protein ParB [Citrobacter amalonaticus]|uniref:Chromosome partitioning protein ParB n=2 Tax=Citrobacter amalonaticus TaxID=35703 RepID=A0A2S4RRD4_CITAM|nr:chromosome partitioning protein ParB [Citrobacter amalonaticus]POT69935.1 chromosome partitioning protein ParB [Citrobacter amalonaticus]POU61194.1 chromosome partitioning protein ParB [Citrobacter amalonaticus]POV02548.1 chromosome partitioning protein ParB [Citrobacter amalonaticus]